MTDTNPYPQPAPAPAPVKKSHTFRNVFLAIMLAMILLVGGCFAVVGLVVNEADKAIDEHNNQVGGADNPIDITGKEGEAFTIGDIDYLAGWKFKDNAIGDADVVGLKVTNNSEDDEFPSIEFRFWKGTEMLTEISCGLLDEVPAGATAKLDCYGETSLPDKHDKITVQNSL